MHALIERIRTFRTEHKAGEKTRAKARDKKNRAALKKHADEHAVMVADHEARLAADEVDRQAFQGRRRLHREKIRAQIVEGAKRKRRRRQGRTGR